VCHDRISMAEPEADTSCQKVGGKLLTGTVSIKIPNAAVISNPVEGPKVLDLHLFVPAHQRFSNQLTKVKVPELQKVPKVLETKLV
jgi:hypothetical protein